MPKVKCPVCGKPFDADSSEAMPFCSPRCRDIDLNRWVSEEYGLPYASEDETPDGLPEDRQE
ncbi:MAG: DNA gyrase inhibitor YacG [Planctomycetia bacterium]